jgi:hypothetical protein
MFGLLKIHQYSNPVSLVSGFVLILLEYQWQNHLPIHVLPFSMWQMVLVDTL